VTSLKILFSLLLAGEVPGRQSSHALQRLRQGD
jgi:hypothetical protein